MFRQLGWSWTDDRDGLLHSTLLRGNEIFSFEFNEEWLKSPNTPIFLWWGTSEGKRLDERGELWIAKSPSLQDDRDIEGWEKVVYDLARKLYDRYKMISP